MSWLVDFLQSEHSDWLLDVVSYVYLDPSSHLISVFKKMPND